MNPEEGVAQTFHGEAPGRHDVCLLVSSTEQMVESVTGL